MLVGTQAFHASSAWKSAVGRIGNPSCNYCSPRNRDGLRRLRSRGLLKGVQIGLAWIIMKRPKTDQEVIWHNGGTARYRGFVGFVKETKTAVVVLSNSDAFVDSIEFDVLGILNAKKGRPE